MNDLVTKKAICKSRNGESGNGMKEMMEMWRIRVRMTGMWGGQGENDGNAGNQGGNDRNQCGNAVHQVENVGNQDGNNGNQAGNEGNAGNQGGNAENWEWE